MNMLHFVSLFSGSVCVFNIILPKKQFLTSGYKSGQGIKKPFSKYFVCLFQKVFKLLVLIIKTTKHNIKLRKIIVCKNCSNFILIECQ